MTSGFQGQSPSMVVVIARLYRHSVQLTDALSNQYRFVAQPIPSTPKKLFETLQINHKTHHGRASNAHPLVAMPVKIALTVRLLFVER